MKVLVIFGTRPEAIKLAPVIGALRRHPDIDLKICVTAQHRQMLDQVLSFFEIEPDFDLGLMTDGQSLSSLTELALRKIGSVIETVHPDFVLVQGDTTTTFAASLSAYYHRIKVAHVEAGLRTGDRFAPWPEEGNRMLTTVLSTLHFAPTEAARDNLLSEGVSTEQISVTGNTVVDSLLQTVRKFDETDIPLDLDAKIKRLAETKRFVLVTSHRRENFGAGFESICLAIKELSNRKGIDFIFPVHMNPKVREPVNRILGSVAAVHLIPPVDYLAFVYLMRHCYFILTDSGGIQEEAPSLGKPVLIMRDKTERPEALTSGAAQLVGADTENIVALTSRLLDTPSAHRKMSCSTNPFGDGHAAQRIVERLYRENGRR